MADTEINGAEVLAEILSKWESNGFEGEPSLDGLSAEEKEAVYKYTIDPKAKLNEYGTHIKDAIQTDLGDARAAELQAEVAAANPPADTDEKDGDTPADTDDNPYDGLDDDDRAYLDSINNENKQKHYNDAQMLDDNEPTMADFFNKEGKTDAQQADLDALNKYFENVSAQKEDGTNDEEFKQKVYDAAALNAHRDLLKDKTLFNEETAALDAEILRKKQEIAKLKAQAAAATPAGSSVEDKDFVIPAELQFTEEEQLRLKQIEKALQEKIADHMKSAGLALASRQVGLETIANIVDKEENEEAKAAKKKELEDILKSGTYIDANGVEKKAVQLEDWQALLNSLDGNGEIKAGERLQGVLTGDQKMTIASPTYASVMGGITATSKKFMDRFAEKTGFKKFQDKWKKFDKEMSESHPKLWAMTKAFGKAAGKAAWTKGKFAIVTALGGPAAGVAYGGYLVGKGAWSTYQGVKQSLKEHGKLQFKDYASIALTAFSAAMGYQGGVATFNSIDPNDLSQQGLAGSLWDSFSKNGLSGKAISEGFSFDSAHHLFPNIRSDSMNWGETLKATFQRTLPAAAGRLSGVIDKWQKEGGKAALKELGNALIDVTATATINFVVSADQVTTANDLQSQQEAAEMGAKAITDAEAKAAEEEIKAELEQQGKILEERQAAEEKAAEEAAKAEEQAKAEHARQHHHGGGHHDAQQSEDKQLEEKIRKDWEDAVKQSEEAIKNGEIGPAPEPAPAPEPKVEIVDEVVRPEDANLGETKEVFRAEGADGSVVTAEESKEGIKYTSKDAEGKTETREVILQRDSDGKASGYYGIAETDNNGEIERRNMTHDEVKTVMANYHHITDHGDAKGDSLNNLEDQIEKGNHRVLPHQTTEVTVNEGNDGNTDGAQPEATQEVMPKEQAENLQKTLQSSHGMYQPEGQQIINSEVENVVVATYMNGVAITATADVQTEAPLQPTQFVQNSETGQLEEKPILDAKGQRAYDPLTMSKNDIVSMGVDAKSGHSVATITDEDGTHKMTVEEFKTAEQLMIKSLPEQQLNVQYAEADRAFRIDHFNEDPKLYGELAAKTLGSENLTVVAVPDGHGVAAFSDHGISSASLENRTTTVAQIGQDGKIHVYEQTPAEAYRGYSLDGKTENVGLPGREITGEKAQQFVRDAVKVYDKAGQGNAAFVNAARDHGWLQEQQQQQAPEATKTGELTAAQMRQMEARQGGRR